jgi:PelA/Pel-15E family pectate lyase
MNSRFSRFAVFSGMILALFVSHAAASVVGTNPPAESLTVARIASLPVAEQAAWKAYLERSQRQRQADKDAFAAELKRAGVVTPVEPPHSNSARSIPLNKPDAWYASAEARHIADVVVSFQTPAGGWGKNTDMSREPRQPGMKYGPNNLSHFLAPDDFDAPKEPEWNYIGTIDNDATNTQLSFLAKVIGAGGDSAAYRASFLRGIEYLLAAQYPNGGWPQVWPLEGGYHDAITFNDDAMTQAVDLLYHVAQGSGEFAFVPQELRKRAQVSFERGIHCILAAQIAANGVLTVWPQQADTLTLKPVSGRNFEPPTPCGSESATILLLLMNDLPLPSAAEQKAIRAAAAWFQKTAIYGQSWERTLDGRQLVPAPGAGPIWARYYQSGSNLPVFADRDKSIHDNVNELSKERRNGYGWYSADPQQALDRYVTWSKEHSR